MKNLQNIEDLFKEALENNEEQLPPGIWNNIKCVLDNDSLVSIKKKYNSLKKIVTLLLLLQISFSIYELSKTAHTDLKKENNLPVKEEISKITPDEKFPEKRYSTKKPTGVVPGLNATNKTRLAKNNFHDVTNHQIKSENSSDIKHSQIFFYNNDDYKMNLNQYAADKGDGEVTNNTQINTGLQYSGIIEKISSIHTDSIKLSNSITLNKILFSADVKKLLEKNKKLKTGKISRFSVTTFFSPDFAYYRLEDEKDDNQPDNATTFNQKEKPDLSLTSGALVDYKLNNRLSVQSGITFSNLSITLDPTTIYAEIDNNTGDIKYRINSSSGYGFVLPSFSINPNVGDSLYVFTSSHDLQFIGIPFVIKYNMGKGKFNFNAFAGTSVNFLTRGKIETLVEKGADNETEVLNNLRGLKKIYFSGSAGIGMEYNLNKKIALTFSPTIRFALNSINKNAPVKSYPNSFGLSTGIKLGL